MTFPVPDFNPDEWDEGDLLWPRPEPNQEERAKIRYPGPGDTYIPAEPDPSMLIGPRELLGLTEEEYAMRPKPRINQYVQVFPKDYCCQFKGCVDRSDTMIWTEAKPCTLWSCHAHASGEFVVKSEDGRLMEQWDEYQEEVKFDA